MPVTGNLVHQITNDQGTGALSLGEVNGKQSFATVFGTGATVDVFPYFLSSRQHAEWEVGTGHVNSSGQMVRDTVLASSNSNALVNFGGGVKDITNDVPAVMQPGDVFTIATRAALALAKVPAVVTAVRTLGYATVGIGGAIYTRAASEPSHAGKVQSADGAWWELSRGNPVIDVMMFGAVGDGVADDATAIQNAINFVDNGAGGTVLLPKGTYLVGAALSSSSFGVILQGAGELATTIKASHSLGPVYRFQRSFCGVRDLTIDATSDRTNGTAGANYGIRGEAADTAGHAVAACVLERVRVVNQPSHGIRIVAICQNSSLADVLVQNNLGHGLMFDSGESSSRVNNSQPGIVTIRNLWSLSNTGHGLVLGHPNDANYPLRFMVMNPEIASNAQAAGVRYTTHQVFMRGEEFIFDAGAFGGNSVTGAVYMQGKGHRFRSPRIIQCTSPAMKVAEDLSTLTSNDIEIEAPRVIDGAQDPLVTVNADSTGVRVFCDYSGNITSLMKNDTTTIPVVNGVESFAKNLKMAQKVSALDFKTVQFSLIDDSATSLEFSGPTGGFALVSVDTIQRYSLVIFRVGDSVQCVGNASSALFTATTGALAGTTGTDTHLTVSAHSDNKLYIENRTGGTRTVTVTFLNISDADSYIGLVG